MKRSQSERCSKGSATIFDTDSSRTKEIVKDTYRRAAENGGLGGSGNGSSGSGSSGSGSSFSDDESNYTMMDESYEIRVGYVPDADLGLGCGIPTDLAGIEEGHRVLDLGSGAGIDAFIARDLAGEKGFVTGVDFTPKMIALARRNAKKLGFNNVTFIDGDIEALPIPDDSVDVVVSNCVLNLVPDKEAAFREMARVIAPGGHFCISDIVCRGHIPDAVRQAAERYAGCVAGALDEKDYLRKLKDAGFENVTVLKEREIQIPLSILEGVLGCATRSTADAGGAIVSITVRGDKPV